MRCCRHCGVSVNRDMNAVKNMGCVSAVARYVKVQSCPDEAQHSQCNSRFGYNTMVIRITELMDYLARCVDDDHPSL